MAIFITGLPGCGKSTLIQKIVEKLKDKKIEISGFVTPEIRKDGKRIGFKVVNLFTNEEGILASLEDRKGSKRFGKYFIHLEDFERIALKDIEKGDVVVIDEIGKMEMLSERFKNIIKELKNHNNLIASVHRDLAKEFKAIDITYMTKNKRERLIEKIIKEFENFISKNAI